MAEQPDELYKARVQQAVLDAVYNCGKRPDGATEIKVEDGADAICQALAVFVASGAMMLNQADHEAAGAAIDATGRRLTDLLVMLAARARDNTLTPKEPPILRVVH